MHYEFVLFLIVHLFMNGVRDAMETNLFSSDRSVGFPRPGKRTFLFSLSVSSSFFNACGFSFSSLMKWDLVAMGPMSHVLGMPKVFRHYC